jgi:hypothetical protein
MKECYSTDDGLTQDYNTLDTLNAEGINAKTFIDCKNLDIYINTIWTLTHVFKCVKITIKTITKQNHE